MRKGSWFHLVWLAALLVPSPAPAANLNVCPAGCAYTSIKTAVNDATDGDVIRIAKGRYVEWGIEISDPKNITIRGGYNAADFSAPPSTDASLTVIDAVGMDSVLEVYAYEETIGVTIENLTITGGYAYDGAGIRLYTNTDSSDTQDAVINATIKNNIVSGNTALNDGGGVQVYCYTYSDTNRAKVNLELFKNRIVDNTAGDEGGAVYVYGSSSDSYSQRGVLTFQMRLNQVSGNLSVDNTGGIYISLYRTHFEAGGKTSFIRNNDISGNGAYDSQAGFYLYLSECPSAALDITNNVFAGNWTRRSSSMSETVGGVRLYSYGTSPTVDFINNTVTANRGWGLYAYSDAPSGETDNFTLNFHNNIVSGNYPVSGNDDAYFDEDSGEGNLVVDCRNTILGNWDDNDVDFTPTNVTLSADPGLGDDFYPIPGSSAINNAYAASLPTQDKDGNARVGAGDIGALEYQGSPHQARMAAPGAYTVVEYAPMERPVVTSDPLTSRPLAVGDVEGGSLEIQIALPKFKAPVDVYAGMYLPFLLPGNVVQFPALQTLTDAGPVKWKNGTAGPVDQGLFGSIPVSALAPLKGVWEFYLVVTPKNAPDAAQYLYKTWAVIK